jgi:hypothetical protein
MWPIDQLYIELGNKEISIHTTFVLCTHFKLQNVLDEHNETASIEDDTFLTFPAI